MRCPQKVDLSAYLDQELPQRHMAKLDRHIQECVQCQGALRDLREAVSYLQSIPLKQCPVLFSAKYRGSLRWKPALAVGLALFFSIIVYTNTFAPEQLPPGIEEYIADHSLGEQLHPQSYGLFGN